MTPGTNTIGIFFFGFAGQPATGSPTVSPLIWSDSSSAGASPPGSETPPSLGPSSLGPRSGAEASTTGPHVSSGWSLSSNSFMPSLGAARVPGLSYRVGSSSNPAPAAPGRRGSPAPGLSLVAVEVAAEDGHDVDVPADVALGAEPVVRRARTP